MTKLFYTVSPEMHRVARIESNQVVELDFEYQNQPPSLLKAIFLGKVVEVQKPLQAAFVDIGLSKVGILPLKEGNLPFVNHGDQVLVQITRTENPLEDKGVRLTRQINLSLGHLVFTPFKLGLNFSKKLKDIEHFKDRVSLNLEEGLVVRSGVSLEDPLEEWLEQLRDEWGDLQSKVTQKAPKLLGGHYSLFERTLRSMGFHDLLETDNLGVANHSNGRASFIREKGFDELCEDAWESLFSPEIHFSNGGNIYIEETHALVVVDVNSQGGMRHALPFNRKVVQEILRQVRLRDLGGKIVVDLIHPPKSWKVLFQAQEIPSDLKVWGISEMGLLELTRQKRRLSLPQRLRLKTN